MTQGEWLSAQDPRGLTLGRGLAANLGVGQGDKVVLLATGATGGINAVEGSVRGIFSTDSKVYDDAALRVPITLARGVDANAWISCLGDGLGYHRACR